MKGAITLQPGLIQKPRQKFHCSTRASKNGQNILGGQQMPLIGTTSSGRATCNRLDLNDERREEPFIQNARRQ